MTVHNKERLDLDSVKFDWRCCFVFGGVPMVVRPEKFHRFIFAIKREDTNPTVEYLFQVDYNFETNKPKIHWHMEIPEDADVVVAVDVLAGLVFESQWGSMLKEAMKPQKKR